MESGKKQELNHKKKYKLLSYDDRKQLEKMYLNNERPVDIALKLGVHAATIYKELQRGNTGNFDKNLRPEYSAVAAQVKIAKNSKNRGRVKKSQCKLNESGN